MKNFYSKRNKLEGVKIPVSDIKKPRIMTDPNIVKERVRIIITYIKGTHPIFNNRDIKMMYLQDHPGVQTGAINEALHNLVMDNVIKKLKNRYQRKF